MCEAPSGQSFHTGQIYAAPYPIAPLFASKLVNFCTYFRHLCIIEKRRPLLSFLLATVVRVIQQKTVWILGCSQSARRFRVTTAMPDRPTDTCNGFALAILCHLTLPFSQNSSEHFG